MFLGQAPQPIVAWSDALVALSVLSLFFQHCSPSAHLQLCQGPGWGWAQQCFAVEVGDAVSHLSFWECSGDRGEQRSAPAAPLGALSLKGPCDTPQSRGRVGMKHLVSSLREEQRVLVCGGHGSVSPVTCQAGQWSVAGRVRTAVAQ